MKTTLNKPIKKKFDKGKNERSVTIKKGDWLSKIAKQYTGDPMRYGELASLNNIENADLINVGDNILLPDSWFDNTENEKNLKMPERPGHRYMIDNSPIMISEDGSISNQSGTIQNGSVQLPELQVYGKRKDAQTPDFSNKQIDDAINFLFGNFNRRPQDPETGVTYPYLQKPNTIKNNVNSDEYQDDSSWYDDIFSKIGLMYDKAASKTGDVMDVIKESANYDGDWLEKITNFLQTAYNGVAKNFSEDKQVKLLKPQTLAQEKPTKSMEDIEDVLDYNQMISSSFDTDTLKWDNNPIDNTGEKYFLQESFPITDDMKFTHYNRGDRKIIDSGNGALTTYKPILKYEDAIKSEKYPAVEYDREGHVNHFMGYDKNGKFKIGPLSEFGPGDTMTQVYYADIQDIPTDKNGNLIFREERKNPGRNQVVFNGFNEDQIDKNGNIVQGKPGQYTLTPMTEKYSTNIDRYGNVNGGRVLLKCGNEIRVVSGTIRTVVNEINKMKKNHKGKLVRYYQLDNGSYNRGIRTKNNKITVQDEKDYDRQNTTSAMGGHFMAILNQ